PVTNLEGDHQRWNAGTATLTVRLLNEKGSAASECAENPNIEDSIRRGLQAVDWPGRWQRIEVGDRHLILDASHNPEGAVELDKNLSRLVAATGRKPI